MAEVFLTLEIAAKLEDINYNTLVQKIQRNPESYVTRSEASGNGGKDRVMVSLESLTAKARKLYKAKQKVDVAGMVIEAKTKDELVPWYVDVDFNWYVERYKEEYYRAVEFAKSIADFNSYRGKGKSEHAKGFAQELGMGLRSLYRYSELYVEASAWALRMERAEGKNFEFYKVLALCRKPRETCTFPSLLPEQRALVENIWFDKSFANNLGTVEMLYKKFEEVGKLKGWEYPSIKTVYRYIDFLMEHGQASNAHFLAANGMREFKNKKMIKGKRDITALGVMEFVQGDEHTFDCWVKYVHGNGKVVAVRPKLVAWIDTRSRMIMGDVLCVDANSQILKESMVKMIYQKHGGVPKHLHIDNGKDYTGKTMTGQDRWERAFDSESIGFYRSIGIDEWSRSLPYEPWSKGQIERFFGSVSSLFTKWMDSYTGTLTGSKTYGKRKKDIKGMLERDELLTMNEFYEVWSKWLIEVYCNRQHEGLRKDGEKYKTPLSLFLNAENKYVKAAPPREYAAILLLKSDRALVRNQGISKFGSIYTAEELGMYVDKYVNVKWDIDDVTKLYVFAEDSKKICEARSVELLQIAPRVSQDALTEHMKRQKAQVKAAIEAQKQYSTPFELRDQGTTKVTGGLDLTIRAERVEKIVAFPMDKEFASEMKDRREKKSKAVVTNEYFNKMAMEAMEKLKALG